MHVFISPCLLYKSQAAIAPSCLVCYETTLFDTDFSLLPRDTAFNNNACLAHQSEWEQALSGNFTGHVTPHLFRWQTGNIKYTKAQRNVSVNTKQMCHIFQKLLWTITRYIFCYLDSRHEHGKAKQVTTKNIYQDFKFYVLSLQAIQQMKYILIPNLNTRELLYTLYTFTVYE